MATGKIKIWIKANDFGKNDPVEEEDRDDVPNSY